MADTSGGIRRRWAVADVRYGRWQAANMGANATNIAQIRINCKNFDIFYRNYLHKCEKSSIFVAAFEK